MAITDESQYAMHLGNGKILDSSNRLDCYCRYVNDNVLIEKINVKSFQTGIKGGTTGREWQKSVIYMTIKEVDEDTE
jgi:hypothetical protein